MSGIRISQLQQQFAVTPLDRLVINDENTTTRSITFANFVNSITNQDLVFDGDIVFNGSTNISSIDGGNAITNNTI